MRIPSAPSDKNLTCRRPALTCFEVWEAPGARGRTAAHRPRARLVRVRIPPIQPQPLCRRATVYRREIVRGGRVTSLLAAEALAFSPLPSPAHLAAQMATRYFGGLASSCAGLVMASATEAGVGDGASCGFVLHPTSVGRLPLIRLGTPNVKTLPGYARLTYPITGGLFVRTAVDVSRHPGFGSFSFEVTVAGTSTTCAVRVDDFAARLLGCGTCLVCRLLYKSTESLLHRMLVARFLRGFVRSLQS